MKIPAWLEAEYNLARAVEVLSPARLAKLVRYAQDLAAEERADRYAPRDPELKS